MVHHRIIKWVFYKSEFWMTHVQDRLDDRQKKVVNRLLDAGLGGFEGVLITGKYASTTLTAETV